MEKLMQYVEQMQKEWINVCRPQVQQYDILYMILISKHYPLIKWLVDNNKIDRKKLEKRPFSDGLVYSDSDCTVYRSDTTYEMLLMLLSISDTPIEDLISYLK